MIEKINSEDNNKYKDFNEKFHKFITEKYTIKDVLEDLKMNIKGAKNIRFRPVDWQGKAVVFVSDFSTEKEENKDPCLYRRVFLDCRDTHFSKIDALSGLEARKAFIDTEWERLNENLKKKLKKDYDLNSILIESFNRLNDDKENYRIKKESWNDFYEHVKNNADEKYMQKPPWKNEEKWPWRKMPKEDFLDQIGETCKYYSELEGQWENYYSDLIKIWEKYINYYDMKIPGRIHDPNSATEKTVPEIALPIKASDKFLGILSYYKDNDFSEDEAGELNKLYSSILAVICLRNRSELLKNIQNVTEAMAGESNLEKIATKIAEGIRKSFIGFKETDVFPILCVCERPIDKTDKWEDFRRKWKISYQKRQEPKSFFSWNDIPGNDDKKLIEFLISFLKQNYDVGWIRNAKIEKNNDGKTIKIFAENNSLLLMLNDEKTKVNLKFDNSEINEFIAVSNIADGKLNIYTSDDKKDHDLWDAEEKLGNIPIREKGGLGRKAIESWQNESNNPKNSKSLQTKNYFTISPDVDNPDSTTGNIQALKNGIRTTGCLPLIFNQQIYGLLYLHCKKRHFFTETELEALETFGTQAAIAIENYNLVGYSYEQLYGTALLNRLEELEEDSVGKKLRKWVTQIRNARAGDIAKITKTVVTEIAEYYGLQETFINQIEEYEIHEGALQSMEDYRDHFIHTFHVFCLGCCIIDEWKKREVKPLEIDSKEWFIAALYHDFGIPLQKLEDLFKKISEREIIKIDWNPILLANGKDENSNDKINKNIDHIIDLSNIFSEKSEISSHRTDFTKWFYKQLIENHDHGALSALMLLNHKWDADQIKVVQQSALAISLHSYRRNKSEAGFDLGQLNVEKFQLAFLLSFCDLAQEWGRNTLLEKISKLKLNQDKKILNNELEKPVDLTLTKEIDKTDTDVRIKYVLDPFTKINDKMTLQEKLNSIADEFGSTWYLEDKKNEFCIVCLDPNNHYIKNIYPGRQRKK